jgi:type I restriction enzyme S subunit
MKHGLMRQLFTCGIRHTKFKKTKLGEIPETWEVKKLSSIGEIITGNTPKTSDKNNYGDEFLFVSPKDIGLVKYINNSEKKLTKKGFSLTRKIPKGSVLMVCIGSTIGKIGIAGRELSTNQQINSVAVNDHYSSEYIYYQLLHRRKDVIGRRSTQAVPIINKTDFSLTELAVPKTRNEQEEIAEILSAIDEKILMNKKLRTKLNKLKKGLMQDLLSGKVRVV